MRTINLLLNTRIKMVVLFFITIQLISCKSDKRESTLDSKETLTQNDSLVYDTAPRWLPEGNSLIFYTYRHDDEGAELYSLNIESREMTRLTNTYHNEWWSEPTNDSKRIFVSSDFGHSERFGGSEIFELNLNDNSLKQITKDSIEGVFNIMPRLSPKGDKLLYSGDYIGPKKNAEIFVVNIDGTERINLTNSPSIDRSGSWSPDGSKIVFSSNRSGNFDLYIMLTDGSEIKQLTDTPWNETDPDWSPDGNQLVFVSDASNERQIYLMDIDGSNRLRLTKSGGKDVLPAWSPNGEWIAFATYRHGKKDKGDIYMIKKDGTNSTRLTPR
ncbi:TolB family protein [Pontimicrobium aquaticum]|uniref:DUF5050 domain-containing protein n=1 Tax=Pontimicrobium aquaticum TaxID=2565367 RepID=A0A4V6WEC7_9FLAO|nr:DPP IV N-terminal domain-containing protein [Pontimicrobium aquaticum]TJY37759.1 DUF5050 domain-containing protein [Pontimicrobium aquaticum]